jgi:CDP-diacylglycerol--serine O-phosphatidyltransferase
MGIACLMVSRIRTFSGKLIGRRIERDFVAPVIGLGVLLVATLATYPYLSVTLGCLVYLAMIPVSMKRYWELKQEYALSQTPILMHEARLPEKPKV